MRRITVFERLTADGYFAAPDGNLDWAVPDDALDEDGAAAMPHTDTILFGRRTYEMFESFWPQLQASPTMAGPHGRRSQAILAMATWIDAARKVVFSRSRSELTWHNSELRRALDPHEIEAMKREPGKDIIVLGSGTIVSQLTEHGLIDEYSLVINPTFLGNGRPMMTGLAKAANLDLLEVKAYASGNVMLRYAPA